MLSITLIIQPSFALTSNNRHMHRQTSLFASLSHPFTQNSTSRSLSPVDCCMIIQAFAYRSCSRCTIHPHFYIRTSNARNCTLALASTLTSRPASFSQVLFAQVQCRSVVTRDGHNYSREEMMSRTHVHAGIYAFRTLCCRLHSISTTQTNTLAYTRRHTVARTVTHTPFAYRHKFRSSLRLAGLVSQATMLYKCLYDISTRFRPLEPYSTAFSLCECIHPVRSYSSSSPSLDGLLICTKCIRILIITYFV
jgi:hypothetical protein